MHGLKIIRVAGLLISAYLKITRDRSLLSGLLWRENFHQILFGNEASTRRDISIVRTGINLRIDVHVNTVYVLLNCFYVIDISVLQ